VRLWPWSVLEDARALREEALHIRTQGSADLDKAANLRRESMADVAAAEGLLESTGYRVRPAEGESWPEYRSRLAKILSEGRQASVTLAILDRLDSKTRDAFTRWLTALPAEAETLRLRASALADFRSELVSALYAASPEQKRAETLRRAQEHNRIYLDNRQAQDRA
jgi:hypothetical protein